MTAPTAPDLRGSMADDIVLRAIDLAKHFDMRRGSRMHARFVVKAVDGVSFELRRGVVTAVVGASGSGKSTVAKVLSGLERPTSGQVLLDGEPVPRLRGKAFRAYVRRVQMVFQDPYASLNPRHTVGEIIAAPLEALRIGSPAGRRTRVGELLETVGLDPAHLHRYPHEFSGGQRQRIGVARALATEPALIVADEPVSALDVSIQAQIVNLLRRLQRELGIAFVFIAHDLAVVRHVSHRVAVMYLGRIVETADRDTLFRHPRHPYTQALLSAVPEVGTEESAKEGKRERIRLAGDVPSPLNPPSGCRFRTRCPRAEARCAAEEPPLLQVGAASGHRVACHFPAVG